MDWSRMVTRGLLLVAGLSVGASGCGGRSVIDADLGAGGAGGSGGAGGPATSSTTSSTTSVTTTATGMVDSLCAQACATLAECDGGGDDCVTTCQERQQGPCGEFHEVWIGCSLGETNTMCGFGPGAICGGELETYLACTGEVVGETGCMGGPDFCSCSVFSSPGIELTQSCGPDGCECLRGGLLVGICTEPDAQCDVLGGCCAGPLFTSAIP